MVPSVTTKAEAVLSAIPKDRPLPTPLALILTVDPFTPTAPVVLPKVVVEVAVEDRVVLPLDVRVVNLALDCVSVPIAVPLIPVKVVLKLVAVTNRFPAVRVKLFVPVLIDEADNPERANAPDVPVTLTAPALTVNPFVAVSNPLEVMVPVPKVAKLPEVVAFPFSLITKVATPLD